jgi:hypothetical protein
MADRALVEGAICDTMDLRRSVIVKLLCTEDLVFEDYRGDAQDVELDAECGDGYFNKLVGQPRRRWSRGSRTRHHEARQIGNWLSPASSPCQNFAITAASMRS